MIRHYQFKLNCSFWAKTGKELDQHYQEKHYDTWLAYSWRWEKLRKQKNHE